jgi:hypothetical protein
LAGNGVPDLRHDLVHRRRPLLLKGHAQEGGDLLGGIEIWDFAEDAERRHLARAVGDIDSGAVFEDDENLRVLRGLSGSPGAGGTRSKANARTAAIGA